MPDKKMKNRTLPLKIISTNLRSALVSPLSTAITYKGQKPKRRLRAGERGGTRSKTPTKDTRARAGGGGGGGGAILIREQGIKHHCMAVYFAKQEIHKISRLEKTTSRHSGDYLVLGLRDGTRPRTPTKDSSAGGEGGYLHFDCEQGITHHFMAVYSAEKITHTKFKTCKNNG